MINIANLLRNAKKGTILWSPLFGPVEFMQLGKNDQIWIKVDNSEPFDKYGRYFGSRFTEAECLLFPSKDCRTWEGWKLPTEPNFKVGDWVVRKDGETFYGGNYVEQITSIEVDEKGKCIWLSSTTWVNDYDIRLWSIADAKDGDVLAADECYVIFKEIDGLNIKCYCTYHYMGFNPSFHIDTLQNKTAFNPATKEQHDQLFAKMQEAGYEWDEKKKELKKIPVEPNFKVGDWIVHTDGSSDIPIQVYGLKKDRYLVTNMLGTKSEVILTYQDKWRLWTIKDAKDGDVLATDNGWTCIFKAFDGCVFSSYCFMDSHKWFCEFGSEAHTLDSRINGNIHPATKEQRELLFAKMREAGYTWDEKKKELRKIIELNFKVGNWICPINGKRSKQVRVVEVRRFSYLTEDRFGILWPISFSAQHEWRLWLIQDANDGDVLVCYSEVKGKPIEQAGIFKQYVGRYGGCSNTFLAHTGIDWDGDIIINGYMGSTNILPATKEQRDQLFAKIKEAGYQWDEKKKELYKIKHYDIANFYAGMPVLVRADNVCRWDYSVFSRITGYEDWKFAVCNGVNVAQCIPFEGNESLLGTTEPCDERFINW